MATATQIASALEVSRALGCELALVLTAPGVNPANSWTLTVSESAHAGAGWNWKIEKHSNVRGGTHCTGGFLTLDGLKSAQRAWNDLLEVLDAEREMFAGALWESSL